MDLTNQTESFTINGAASGDELKGGSGNDSITGKGGNDIIFGYAGGDRISGGEGNDFIDGGADGTADQFGYAPKDDAIYFGKAKNYEITTYKASDAAQLKAVKDLAESLGFTIG